MAKRTRITRPYPTHSFQDTLPIAETIQRVNGGLPVETELLAEAMGTSARSRSFIQKLNASSKYGLTLGSYSDDFIRLTELGESVTAPVSAEERQSSILEAVTTPDVFCKFYRIYAGKRMPEDIYASNTLIRELGVPRELTEECLGIIRRNGLIAGLVSDQSGVLVVGSVAESQDPGYYAVEGYGKLGRDQEASRRGKSEDTERSSEGKSDILVVAVPDDSLLSEATTLVEGLSVWCKSVVLDADGGRIVSQELSEALDSALGCVFIWPDDAELQRASAPTLWTALGALSYRLGQKLVVVLRSGEDDVVNLMSSDPTTTLIRVDRSESIYPKLMAALVQSGIVRISVG